ncbi:Sigma-70 region 2 [Filimonas lacunae]|uniref:Sigma-70 region 2 n=1 Tax=Filimonas lacunae TaxID=477680 RepID=A0A1N7R8D3_9BACT|nr:sigma factor [Filimonas lacunae]SIT31371.1 Sigma-70 region 2 [Filimonas lacunae]
MEQKELDRIEEIILFRKMSKGDTAAFDFFFDKVSNRVYGYLLKMTKNEAIAGELLQSVFIELWDQRKNFDTVMYPRAFLLKIVSQKLYPVVLEILKKKYHRA